jgi:hypothetical protein
MAKAHANNGRTMRKNIGKAPRLRNVEGLSLEELEDILGYKKFYMDWFNDVESMVYKEAQRGKTKKYKLVHGRSFRTWKSIRAANEFFNRFNIKKRDREKVTMISPAQAEKIVRVSRKELSEALNEVCFKPPGKLTLVPMDDKRKSAIDIEDDILSYFD